MAYRIDYKQQLVIDTSAGTDASGTIPEDTDPSFNTAMYAGYSWWITCVAGTAHYINVGAAATSANGEIPVSRSAEPEMIKVGTVIHALAVGGATTAAKVSFFRCYPL